MKRIYTLITLLLLTGILLPSCGLTIEKRKHNKGFYVHNNRKAPEAKEHKGVIRPEEPSTLAATETETVIPDQIVSETTEKTAPGALTDKTPAPAVPNEVPAAKQKNRNAVPHNGIAQHRETKSPIEKMAERNPLKKKLDNQKMKARAADEALSLFWIVILILLILWAVGVISGGWGLGGVIYILLIIALVLLILWLLRIV